VEEMETYTAGAEVHGGGGGGEMNSENWCCAV